MPSMHRSLKLLNSLFLVVLVAIVSTGCANLPFGYQKEKQPAEPQITDPIVIEESSESLPDYLCSPSSADSKRLETAWEPYNLWDRLRAGHQLDYEDNNTIERHIKWFKKHPEYIDRVTRRGSHYLFFIAEELESRNMPAELAYLPIVESAFDPFAYSPGRASGMWQIIPSTGKMLGLKQSWWYDGRRDVVASTDAALNYLESLYQRFDDWYLALAAYNSGQGTVGRAIRRNKSRGKPTDYWHLDLPRETRNYVPKLLALAEIFENPKDYGLSLTPIDNEPVFASVNVGGQIDLAQAAELAGIKMEDLYQLNPGFNRWATDPSGPHRIVVPISKKERFQNSLETLPSAQRVAWLRHTIKSGETLSHIANKYDVSVDTLKTLNNIHGSTIRAGKTIIVPQAAEGSDHYSHSVDQRLARKYERSGKDKIRIDYIVQPGDSFWKIGKQFSSSSRQVAQWNNLAPGDPLRIGQRLVIWQKPEKLASLQPTISTNREIRKLSYRVRKGDSLYKIASKFRVGVDDIVKWNQISEKSYLQPGQSLVLYVDVTSSSG